jgi:hypothetical protein
VRDALRHLLSVGSQIAQHLFECWVNTHTHTHTHTHTTHTHTRKTDTDRQNDINSRILQKSSAEIRTVDVRTHIGQTTDTQT